MKTLQANAMNHQADYDRKQFLVEVGPDVSQEDILKPGFWVHHTRKVSKNDVIEVLGSGFELRLRVLEVGLGLVKTRLLSVWQDEAVVKADAETDEVQPPDGYVVDHHSKTRWRARMNDGTEIARGLTTKQEAVAAAREHAIQTGAIAA